MNLPTEPWESEGDYAQSHSIWPWKEESTELITLTVFDTALIKNLLESFRTELPFRYKLLTHLIVHFGFLKFKLLLLHSALFCMLAFCEYWIILIFGQILEFCIEILLSVNIYDNRREREKKKNQKARAWFKGILWYLEYILYFEIKCGVIE